MDAKTLSPTTTMVENFSRMVVAEDANLVDVLVLSEEDLPVEVKEF